jgi:hypothetical protein
MRPAMNFAGLFVMPLLMINHRSKAKPFESFRSESLLTLDLMTMSVVHLEPSVPLPRSTPH